MHEEMQENIIKVVVMVPSPLTPRWLNNFSIDALAASFDVEYWDCGAICDIKFEAAEVVDRPYVRTIGSLKDLEENLKRLPKDAVMISQIHLEANNYKVHKLIARYNPYRVWIFFWANAITENTVLVPQNIQAENNESPLTPTKVGVLKRIKRLLYKSRPIYYIGKYIRYKGDYRFKQMVSIDKQMDRIKKNRDLYKHEYIIDVRPNQEYSINHPDFEKYLQLIQSDNTPLISGKYIVFLDSFFPFHPHLRTENPSVDFDALVEHYFNSLNQFFDKIEKAYDCEVVIAGHPTAQFSSRNPYGKRKVVYFKTAELVKEAFAVCLHSSFSVSFAFLFDKPFCLLTNAAIRQSSNQCSNLQMYSKVFEHPLVDTDIIEDVRDIFAPTKPEIRDGYNNMFFDIDNRKLNAELLVENIERIHNDIINNQNK